jgi:two-component system cell cycle sensor histidine kinase/response regulator CckA
MSVNFFGVRDDRGGEAQALIDAFPQAAALVSADGAIVAANGAWRARLGAGRRLPRPAGALFAAFLQARRSGQGEGVLSQGGVEHRARVGAVGPHRFLVRLDQTPVAPPVTAPSPTLADTSRAGGLDPFAAASPFGAALIDGADPFGDPIAEANGALSAIAGREVGAGDTLGDLLAPVARSEAAAGHAAGRPGPYEVTLAGDEGKTVHLYLVSAGARTAAYLLDITEQKAMQLQLAQRNKLEAIGQLAGGVAHDFNNLLSAIQLHADKLLLRHPLGDPAYEDLAVIRTTVFRAADLVRQLLTFSRKATIQRESLDLGAVLSNFDVLLHRLLREDVRLETHYGPNLPMVRADKAQLENAVINLVVNARDAALANGGGTVRLRAARLSESEACALGYGGGAMGDMALIEVADDGAGIAPDVIGHIFEPFFTTKGLGEGTGLGLATVYGIVKQSDGWISVHSDPGEGATFRIFLPDHIPPLAVEPPPGPAPVRSAARDLSGVGRILFVEDEAAVRRVAASILRERGYEVIEAADGEEALALAEQHAGAIDLMISDVIMPGIDGPALLKAARPFLGAAPVMFISGYAEAEFSDLLEGERGVSFLAKPLDIMSLAERVKQELRGA